VVGGGAVALAADDVAWKIRAIAAGMLEADRAQVRLAAGTALVGDDASRSLPLAVVAKSAYTLGYVFAPDIGPSLESTRTYKMPNVRHTPDELGRFSTYTTFSNAVHVCIVEVDADTGVLQVLGHAIVHDCGTQVNPLFVEGQVRGGVVMGIGAALGESIRYHDDGRLASDGLKQYVLQRAVDLPPLAVGHRETPSPFSSLGAKGAGESGYAAAAASLLGAVNDALRPHGVSVNALPVSPPRLLAAIQKAAR
jgi:carbon-monoxide dehydrogenase large subunit